MEDGVKYTIEYETHEEPESITKLSSEFRLRKLVGWAIRTLIAVILFISFWEYAWIKWLLAFYIPLNVFGLYSIFKFTNSVDKKIEEVIQKIDKLEETFAAEEEE